MSIVRKLTQLLAQSLITHAIYKESIQTIVAPPVDSTLIHLYKLVSMKLSTKPTSPIQSVIIYGAPKTGKTQLAGELAKEFNLIWFDLENGYATLTKMPMEWQERIEIISIPDTRDYPIAIETCLKVIRGNPVTICEIHGKVDCPICKQASAPTVAVNLNALSPDTVVVFDSITQLTNSAIAFITKGKPDDYKLDYDDWAKLGKLMDAFFSAVQQAKFHVVCISHETESEMEDGKLKLVPTAGTRNFSRNVAKYFGHVVYADVKNMKHTFNSKTASTLNIVTGSRTDVDTAKMAEPSLIPIFKSVKIVNQSPGQVAAQNLGQINKPENTAPATNLLAQLQAKLGEKK
jgi:hypothetical protein